MHRCAWAKPNEPLYIQYHDEEWGVPVYDDDKLFEMLILEGVQAGLSWITVLKKRDNYQKALNGFDARKIARYNEKKIQQLLNNPGIIRNKLKINAAILNAQAFLEVQEQYDGFQKYIWQFVEGQPIVNRWRHLKDIPATTAQSDAMSKDLKKSGFKFVGSTICYAYMQAVGMVNDHTTDCFRYKEITKLTNRDR